MKRIFYLWPLPAFAFKCLTFFLIIANSLLAGVRCDLLAESCLDYTSTVPLNITVPVNTTRIAVPMSVCMGEITGMKNVDFVFIVDQSSSMSIKDAAYNAPLAVKSALNYLQANAPNSNVGFIGFANGLCDGTQVCAAGISGAGQLCTTPQSTLVQLAPLTANYALVDAQTNYNNTNYHQDCGATGTTGTSYVEPLTLAQQWLNASQSGYTKVIIFITDGEPLPRNPNLINFENFVADLITNNLYTSFPALYALFIGGEEPTLEELADSTGGTSYFNVQPGNLESILQSILQEFVVAEPSQTTVTNTTNLRTGTATEHLSTGQGEYALTLDRVVALDGGVANTVAFATTALNTPDYSQTVTINTTGDSAISVGAVLINAAPFAVWCYNDPQLVITDNTYNRMITELGFDQPNFGVALHTSSTLEAGQIVQVVSPSSTAPTALDTNLRGLAPSTQEIGDVITVTWTHPDDPRETAVNSVIISSNFGADEAVIIDGNRDGQGDSIFIKFKEPLTALPPNVTSIDWPAEGSPGHTAASSDIFFMPGDNTTVVIVLPGVLDRRQAVFPPDVTVVDQISPPLLTLPDGTWATVNTSMMVAWEPPPNTDEVIVFADNDRKYGGQSAGFTLAHKLAVRDGAPAVRVEMPPDLGTDWNDALMADQAAA